MRKTRDSEKGFHFKTKKVCSWCLGPGGGCGSPRDGAVGREAAARPSPVLLFGGSRINAVLLCIIASFLWLV